MLWSSMLCDGLKQVWGEEVVFAETKKEEKEKYL